MTAPASEDRYERNIVKHLIDGLRELIFGPRAWDGMNIYKRLLKVPTALSFFLSLAYFLLCIVPGLVYGTTYWHGVIEFFMFVVASNTAPAVRALAKSSMLHSRLHGWLRHKFDTWEEAGAWFDSTPEAEIEKIAGLPDSAWEPREGGGVIYNEDEACV